MVVSTEREESKIQEKREREWKVEALHMGLGVVGDDDITHTPPRPGDAFFFQILKKKTNQTKKKNR